MVSGFKELETKSQTEIQQDRQKIFNDLYLEAQIKYDKYLNTLNIEQRAVLEAKRGENVENLRKGAWAIFERGEAMAFQLYKMKFLINERNKQFLRDIWKELMFLWLKNTVESGSKGVQTFMSDFEKIVTKGLTG